MRGQGLEEMERFVAESVAAQDANACMAAFVLAREEADGIRLRWVRQVLEGIDEFPDTALTTLRALEATTRDDEREAAVAQAEFAAAQAEAEARLPGLEAPSDREIARRVRDRRQARRPAGRADRPGPRPSRDVRRARRSIEPTDPSTARLTPTRHQRVGDRPREIHP